MADVRRILDNMTRQGATMEGRMLAHRFEYDGKPIVSLNSLQIQTKAEINRKIAAEIYQFDKVSCVLCGSSEFEPLAQKDRYGLWMRVVICTECGLVQTNPRMNEASYREFYNLEYPTLYHGVGKPSDAVYKAQYNRGRRIFARLLELRVLPQDLRQMQVFEVGCGMGGVLGYFRDRGCLVRGVDVGREYAEFGRDPHGLPIEVGTASDVSFTREPDLIIYSHLLEHLLDPARELALIRQTLSDEGTLYLEVPGIKHLADDRMDLLRVLLNAHTYHFSLTSLEALARKSGFKLLSGSEAVQAVFRKSREAAGSVPVESDYEPALSYLRGIEQREEYRSLSAYPVGRLARSSLKRLLKVFGLLDSVQWVYYKVWDSMLADPRTAPRRFS